MARNRAARWAALATGCLGAITTALSCTTFGSDPHPDPDATTEASTPGDDGAPSPETGTDGAPRDGGPFGALSPVCPAPSGGTMMPDKWKPRALFVPAAGALRRYPFSIATDATHVTWVAQVGTVDDGGPDTDPYNGIGLGDVLRVAKTGGPATTLARGQRFARALALDGDHAYWATFETDGLPRLVRQRRDADCALGCPPEPVTTFPAGPPIVRLLRAVPGVLFALAENGDLFRYELGTIGPERVLTSAPFPALALTDQEAYLAAEKSASVRHTSVGKKLTTNPLFDIAAVDGGPLGVGPIATDCASLWMVQQVSPPRLLRCPIATPGMVTSLSAPLTIAPFDLAADSRFVYSAAPNAGGVFAIDKLSGVGVLLQGANVFQIAVDGDGVYFGEHDRKGTGKITMFVKQ
jgi:hypothetical protein